MFVVLAACAVEPTRDLDISPLGDSLSSAIEIDMPLSTEVHVEAPDDGPDVCALATQLPPEDLCSQICDPDALAQSMLDAGAATGRCYLFICQLPEDVIVSVGVCLP